MKLRITSFLLALLAIACSTEEVEITETVTTEYLSLNQRIVDQLNAEGFEAVVTDDNKVATIGFKSPESFVSKMNTIFENLGESNRKIDMISSNSQNRMSDTQCEQGEPYTSDDGAECVAFVCWGTGLAPISMGSVGDVHYTYFTSCSGGN